MQGAGMPIDHGGPGSGESTVCRASPQEECTGTVAEKRSWRPVRALHRTNVGQLHMMTCISFRFRGHRRSFLPSVLQTADLTRTHIVILSASDNVRRVTPMLRLSRGALLQKMPQLLIK